jgi:putative membrane protein
MPRLALFASTALILSAVALAGCNPASRDKAKDESAAAANQVENAAANAASEAKTVASQAKNAVETAAADHGMGGPKPTADFLRDAAVGDMFEIRSSELALKVSTDPAVKKFAHHMIMDHTRMSHEMKAAATKAGAAADLPTDLDGTHQTMLSDLRSAAPQDFDHKYLEDQRKGHDEALGMFKAYGDKGSDATIKAAAAGAVPTIQGHLDEVKALLKAEDDAKAPGK